MNENIDLTKILKDCPKGTKLYSSTFGVVEFQYIIQGALYPIFIKLKNGVVEKLTPNGALFSNYEGECILFPSKGQRDWSKFTAPWYKKDRFDPKTLQPFDKVLVRRGYNDLEKIDKLWRIELFETFSIKWPAFPYHCLKDIYQACIPYNDETKHLLGTTEEAPEYYRYWED